MNAWITGALAGTAATLPMTLTMKGIHRELPWRQRSVPIPPRQITMQAAEAVGVDEHMDEPARKTATLLAHYGYGASVGAAYGAMQHRLPGRPAVRGMLFGLGVWAGSYLGWLPAANVLPSATRWPAGRNLMMIASHLVWGAFTGVLMDIIGRANTRRRN